MEQIALNITAGVVIAIVSAWVTVQLSLRKFRSERWWERKITAYERVIESLHHSKAFDDMYLEARYLGTKISEERERELRSHATDAQKEIDKVADVGGFLLSQEALSRLRKYQKAANEARNTEDFEEYLVSDMEAVSSCLEDMIEIAKRDLK